MNPVHLRRVGLAVTVVALLMGTMAPAIATPVDGTRPVTSTSMPRGSISTSFPRPSSTWHQPSTTVPYTSSTFHSSTTSIPHTSSTLPTTTVPETTTTVPETTTTESQTTTTVETTTTDPESTTTSQVTSTTALVTTTSAAEAPSTTALVDPAQQTTTTVATPSTLPFTGGGPGQTVALVAGALLLTGIGLVVRQAGRGPLVQGLDR